MISKSPRRSHRRTWRLIIGLAMSILVVWAATRAGTALIVTRELPSPDALIGLASHEWERLPELARLAREHPTAVVLLTAPVHVTDDNCHRCGERIGWLASLGVNPSRVVVLPRRGRNTYEEALAALDYCRSRPVRDLTIVTSLYHTRRALTTFASVFAHTHVALGVAPATPIPGGRVDHWWLRAYDRWYVRYEWAALGWYAVRHRVRPFVAATRSDYSYVA